MEAQNNIKTDDLRKVGSDLNKVLELDPRINTKAKKEELIASIKEAANLLEDGDNVEELTFNTLLELECDVPAKVKIVGSDCKKRKIEKKVKKNKLVIYKWSCFLVETLKIGGTKEELVEKTNKLYVARS